MKLPTNKLLLLASLAVITNGLSLLGIGQASAGSVARQIECNTSIAHNLQLNQGLQRVTGTPPAQRDEAFPGPFMLECRR